MKIRKAYKFRLKPDDAQRAKLENYVGACRFLWNKVLRLNLDRLSSKQHLMWYQEADFWSKQWKASDEYGFLKAVPAHCLQQKLKDLSRAFTDAFDKTQPLKRLPRFKKRGVHDSIRFPEPKQITLNNRRIKLPKLGWLGFFKSQAMIGDIKNATVSKEAGQWYVSVQVEHVMVTPIHTATSCLGIDVGINRFASCSDGNVFESPDAFKAWRKRLACAQRQLARKKKFSMNWRKQQTRIQKIHRKIARIRHDFLHKLSTRLCKRHALVVVEDLKISNMSRSASGTLDSPGRHVSAKSGLNQSILDQGWGEFRRQLAYKLKWLGGELLAVNPKYTSQRCNGCGYTDKANRKSQAEFECIACGHIDHADMNAAKNILAAGHAVLACGEIGLPNSVKQEPLGIGNLLPA